MLCSEAEKYIDAYMGEALSAEYRRDLENHVSTCAACAEKLRHAQGLMEETSSALRWSVPESDVEEEIIQQVAATSIVRDRGWGDLMREQWERAPWWMISAAVHAVILMLMTVITVATAEKKKDDIVITTDLAKKKEPEYDENKIRDIFRNTKEVEAEEMVENPVFVHEEVEVTDHFETENDMDMHTARGQEDAISDIPLGGTGVVGNIGVGGGGAGCFGYRSGGGRKRAVARFGGSRASESAVDAALRWLARHQEPAGFWDCDKYEGGGKFDVGMTGFACLAFLGAGHTERAGKFRQNVVMGVKWLVNQQKKKTDGSLFMGHHMYEHGIGTLALAEAYGMARNPVTGEAAQKGIDHIKEAMGPYEAWNYGPKTALGRNDTSVTGWQVMALKSARVAGLKVDGVTFQGAIAWLDKAQDLQGAPQNDTSMDWEGGKTAYAGTLADVQAGRGGWAMCAAGAMMRQFLGWKRGDPAVYGPGNLMMKQTPDWGAANFYYWYYGTLCMFQLGGKWWKAWNAPMRDMLIQNQRKGGDEDGSWDPIGGGGVEKSGGRVMSTALGALCLEVYYRYLPMYGK